MVFATSSTLAQNIIYTNDEDELVKFSENNTSSNQDNRVNKKSKVDYKVNVGSAFTSNKFGNAVSLYTAPEIRFKLTPKLNISTGFLVANTTVSGYYLSENSNKGNFTNTYIYTGIDYYATERLRISGEILYGLNKSPYSFSKNNNSSDYYLRFSAEYKITKNLSVGLQVIKQNNGYPGYRDPFYNDPFGNYYDPFNPFSRY